MAQRVNEAKWLEKYNRWQIKVQKEGERKTFYSNITGTKGKIDCEKQADKWLEKDISNDNIRFGKAWEEFLEYKKSMTGTSNYKQLEYTGRLYFLPKFKHKKLNSIRILDWQECIIDAFKQGKSYKSLMNMRGCATAFYSYTRMARYEMIRPEYITIPKDAQRGSKSILQPDSLKILFSSDKTIYKEKEVEDYFINAYRYIVVSGLRRGEACALKKSDMKDDIVHVQRSINRFNEITPGKTSNANRFYKQSEIMKQITASQQLLLKNNGIISPYVFPDSDGTILRPNKLYTFWVRYCEHNNISCTLHELRHTFISYMYNNVPKYVLKKSVGHSKNMNTENYVHSINGEDEIYASKVDETFMEILQNQ